jgi:cysteine-rich repeat protein
VRSTGCAGETAIALASTFGADEGSLDNCYCGTSDELCFEPGEANGQCKAQIEAALETTDSVEVLARLSGAIAEYPIVGALGDLLLCEGVLFTNVPELNQCGAQCTVGSECGDGAIQDRTLTDQASLSYLVTDATGVVRSRRCSDDETYSQRGCWVEECDDGNADAGDGCDSACFLEACGNGRLQDGEECDDGNTIAGDGCDASCGAEFDCGDGMVAEPFEECDPPDTGMVCSQQQYEANAMQCGCDARCRRKVCGDGVIQAPEECDPPGPACRADCTRDEDECVGCLRLVDQEVAVAMSVYCASEGFLDGDPNLLFPGAFELGCQNDPVCYDLLLCTLESQCSQDGSLYACYCGVSMQQQAACAQSSFEPVGVCKDEMLDAFASWNGGPPASNEDFWANLLVVTGAVPGRYPAAFAVDFLIRECARPGSRAPSLGDLITASGHPASEAQRCMAACFP